MPLPAESRPPARRPLLIFHPAGPFFALAAIMAAALPWLWLFPLEDARLAHVRLGLFGFAGLTVCGYVMTAQKAWTGREFPLPVLGLAVPALAARLLSLAFPQQLWPVLCLSLPVALAILWPVLRVGRRDKLPLAAVPLLLIAAETALLCGHDLVPLLPTAMAALIFLVGGRLVPSFLAEARRRRGLETLRKPPLWLGAILLGAGLADGGPIGTAALLAAALWVVLQLRDGLRLGEANRMLCLAYGGLVPGLLGIAAARWGLLPRPVEAHLLTMAAMGPMILAISARVTMRRAGEAELMPRRRHRAALGLIDRKSVV